jgi:peroxiredoxin
MTEATVPELPRAARGRRRWTRWLLDLSLGVAIYLALSWWQERHLLATRARAPAFELRALSGERLALDDLRGKRVLLHFWATWCGVCRREFSALNAVHAGLGPDEVLVSIVANSEDLDAIRQTVREEALGYPVLLATDAVVRAYRVSSFPTNYFIDADGRVRDRTVGMSTRWGLAVRLGWAR